ncbi:MAG: FAD-dependent oxidoreductase [Clostridia bacterium]|nr:FAD-dependent oxidoreductase [Clostridia bacterium]
MDTFSFPVNYDGEWDIIVCGGGAGGISCAVEARSFGAKVLILEKSQMLGGCYTQGLVSPPLGGFTQNTFAHKIITTLGRVNGDGTSVDFEKAKILFTKLAFDAGVEVYYGCSVCQAIKDGNTITGVVYSTQNGLHYAKAKIFVDATGDGVLSALAGEKTEYGRADGLVQPMSIMFTVQGVDENQDIICYHEEMDTPLKKGNYLALCRKANAEGKLPPAVNIVRLYKGDKKDERMVNATQVNGFNPLIPRDVGVATADLRAQVDMVVDFLKDNVEGFENIRVKASSVGAMARESRRVIGLYTITAEDLLEGKKHEDVIVHDASFCIDIHNPSGAGQSEQDGRPKQSKPYDIPYRAVVPAVNDNLYTAGRCISGTHRAHASYRVMNICLNVGQAVGIASALCVKLGLTPKTLDYTLIQDELKKRDIDLFN